MEIQLIKQVEFQNIDWNSYDVIFLSCGFEARSTHVFQSIPNECHEKCVILGFHPEKEILSRFNNRDIYNNFNLKSLIFSDPGGYDAAIKDKLELFSNNNNSIKIFVDYSAMTRLWYGYLITWLRYSGSVNSAIIDFCYVSGEYIGDFSNFQIKETIPLSGFEGATAGTRRTVALYGLGYDQYATLAVHEMIEPDSFICFMAANENDDDGLSIVSRENRQIIELSGRSPIILPFYNIENIVDSLIQVIDGLRDNDEIMVVPMGPKTHVLASLLASHKRDRLTCIHTVGERLQPVQVNARNNISCCRIEYK